jgi:hypothetical protein
MGEDPTRLQKSHDRTATEQIPTIESVRMTVRVRRVICD